MSPFAACPHRLTSRACPKTTLLRKRLAAGFGGEPNEDQAHDVNGNHDRTSCWVTAFVRELIDNSLEEFRALGGLIGFEQTHQVAGLQDADSGNDPAEVEAKSLPRGPHG